MSIKVYFTKFYNNSFSAKKKQRAKKLWVLYIIFIKKKTIEKVQGLIEISISMLFINVQSN